MNAEEIIYLETSEEYKAIKWLENKTTNYGDDSLILHYNNILYYLIMNLMKENQQLKENNMSMQEEMARTWKKLDDLQQIEQEHQKINGELREENKKYKEVIDKAIEFTNKKWGTWCTHHLEYMTELQNILKEVSK